MRKQKIWASFIGRGCSAFFAFGVGLLFEGSIPAYIGGAICIVFASGLFCYNWRHPTDDYIPTIAEAIQSSKIVWSFWHSGNRARASLYYGTVERILLLEPDPHNEAFKHVLTEVSGRPTTEYELMTEINLTKNEAKTREIEVRWHNEITSQSFMICDPSPNIEEDLVTFSSRAYVVTQVLDRNINIEEWAKYKKSASKDKYAFENYVSWFKDIWENRSKAAS